MRYSVVMGLSLMPRRCNDQQGRLVSALQGRWHAAGCAHKETQAPAPRTCSRIWTSVRRVDSVATLAICRMTPITTKLISAVDWRQEKGMCTLRGRRGRAVIHAVKVGQVLASRHRIGAACSVEDARGVHVLGPSRPPPPPPPRTPV